MAITGFNRESIGWGAVYFRGTLPPRPEEFAFLRQQGISIKRREPSPVMHWALELEHPHWGRGYIAAFKDNGHCPKFVLHDHFLTVMEKKVALQGTSSVQFRMPASLGNILRTRKNLLRFLSAIMAEDGLVAMDFLSQRFWSRAMLEDELCHDADLDIEALINMHLVSSDDSSSWFHSHGLGEIGAFDFDILRPSPDLLGMNGADAIRAIAFAIVEGLMSMSTPRFRLASSGPDIRCVSVPKFHRRARPEDAALRGKMDHTDKRVVLCEPGNGLLGFWRNVLPSKLLSQPLSSDTCWSFSNEASNLMAKRAKNTYTVFQRCFHETLGSNERSGLVKLGYLTDDGRNTEHLWFEVHECFDDVVEATLLNSPFFVRQLQEGERGRYSLENLSDWNLLLPYGSINPRSFRTLRQFREAKSRFDGKTH